jgi:hypothetical protein
MRDGVLEHHWELVDERTKTAKIGLLQNKKKEVLAELDGKPSRGHISVNKTLEKVTQQYYWLHFRSSRWCHQCDTC